MSPVNVLCKVADQYNKYRQPRQVIVKRILEVIDLCPQPLAHGILDIGSGPGHYAEIVANATSKTVFCLDNSKEMLGYVKQVGNLVPIKRDINEDFLLRDLLFSFIYSVNFMHYVEDIYHFFNNVKLMLASQGILLLATRSKEDLEKQTLGYYFPDTIIYEKGILLNINKIFEVFSLVGFSDIHIENYQLLEKMNTTNIEAFRMKAYSALHKISERHFTAGILRMNKDFLAGDLFSNTNYTVIWGRKDE